MSGQSKIIKSYARYLVSKGWVIAFMCIPNTVHFGVVPIPIIQGSSKQRYPDIVAFKDNQLLITEVEMALNDSVFEDICLRFFEMEQSLNNKNNFDSWIQKVDNIVNFKVPLVNSIVKELVVVKATDIKMDFYNKKLSEVGINLVYPSAFQDFFP
jgi:hypothetical protein